MFFKHRINLRYSHFGGRKVVADGMEEVMKCMVAEDPTLVRQSKLTVAKLRTKWFSMQKACRDYVDSQQQTDAAYEEPPSYYAKMQECFKENQKNRAKGCRYGIQSSTSGPLKQFGFGVEGESTSLGESAKTSEGSTVRTSIFMRM